MLLYHFQLHAHGYLHIPQVDIFHISKECHNVEVAELSPHVISVINDLLAVEASGCTPVRGAATDVLHSFQCLVVGVPVWGVMVDRGVI